MARERYPRRAMPRRATKRGDERTPLGGDYDVLICGASFAGLDGRPRARRQRRPDIGRRPLRDRRAPDLGLRRPDRVARCDGRRRLDPPDLRHAGRPHAPHDGRLPPAVDVLDLRLPRALRAALGPGRGASSRPRRSRDARGPRSHTDRGDLTAPLIVDALGWKRVLAGNEYQPPDAPLSRGLEVHPHGASERLEIWIDRGYVPAGYGWSFPARDEVRIGVGSFDPRFHVKEPTVRLAEDLDSEAVRYQGNWIPHKLRPATADGVFFVGDSAGHCLPLTAEGIRTAFYFGIACGRELRAVVEAGDGREAALQPLRRASPTSTSGSSSGCCAPRRPSRGCRRGCWPRACAGWSASRSSTGPSATTWRIAPPEFADAPSRQRAADPLVAAAA